MNHCCTTRHYFFSIKKCGEPACTICHPPRCSPEDFEQLYHLPDPIPGEDLHYKSFEELYGKKTTEDHRPSLKDAKMKTKKGKMKIKKDKHNMPFCPSAIRAKNVGIAVTCIECEKPRLLFSAKKLSEKDKTILQGFLDTIFYTCGMSFYNTCDLTTAVPPKQQDIQENEIGHDDEKADDQENIEEENEIHDDDRENIEEDDYDENNEDSDSEDEEFNIMEDNNVEDSIRELFTRVFVNNSWSCASQIEKPYYSAGIYPEVCIECGNLDVTKPAKGEFPYCSCCKDNTTVSKKRLKWKQGGKSKGKRRI